MDFKDPSFPTDLPTARAEIKEYRAALEAKDAEIKVLRTALEKAEEADEFHVNCGECNGEGEPESCSECFPFADDARLMRRAVLGIAQPTDANEQRMPQED